MLFSLRRKKRDKPGKRRVRGELAPLGWRARPGAAGPTPEERAFAVGAPDYPVVDGPHYIDVLDQLHRRLKPTWYLEIGAFTGLSLSVTRGAYVAVDPMFRLGAPPPIPGQAHLMQMTSADFFASGFLARNAIRPDLAFLDGLHLFEALLDDFIAAERHAAEGGMIVLHDCLPSRDEMTARTWDEAKVRFWTGDVWKVIVILRALRPDLRITILDAWPTGLALIDRLDPANTTLAEARDAQVAALRDVSLRAYGLERFFGALDIRSSHAHVQTLP